MDFGLTETQQMVQDTARRVAQEVLAPRAAETDRSTPSPPSR